MRSGHEGRRVRRCRAAALSCFGAAALQGCYSSVAAPLSGPAPTGEVHVELTPAGASALVSTLGPRASMLDGRLVGRTDSTFDVVVSRVARTTGSQEDWPSDRVIVPLSAV